MAYFEKNIYFILFTKNIALYNTNCILYWNKNLVSVHLTVLYTMYLMIFIELKASRDSEGKICFKSLHFGLIVLCNARALRFVRDFLREKNAFYLHLHHIIFEGKIGVLMSPCCVIYLFVISLNKSRN